MTEVKRVLLVDDHSPWLNVMSTLVKEWGPDVEVMRATSACEALDVLATHGPFDVAIIDLSLQDGSGIDILRTVQMHGCRTPFVVLSGTDDVSVISSLRNLGVRELVRKPSSPTLLRSAVDRAIAFYEPLAS